MLVFAYGVARPLAKYRRGQRAARAAALGAARAPARRRCARSLSHASIRRRDPYVGWAHARIFYGFVTLFIGTVDPGDQHRRHRALLRLALLQGRLLPRLLDRARRARAGADRRRARDDGPPRGSSARASSTTRARTARRATRSTTAASYRVGDWAFVGLLLVLGVTGYLLEGVRIAMDSPGYDEFSPLGWVVAQGYDGLGLGERRAWRRCATRSGGPTGCSRSRSSPRSRTRRRTHMLTSFASLVLKDPLAGKRLRAIPPERASEPAGYGTLADFSAVHLLQLDACTKCGKCHEACPANADGSPLSPRDVILELREQANGTMQEVGVGGVLGTLLGGARRRTGRSTCAVVGEDRVRVGDDLVVHAVQRVRRGLPGRHRAGADHQPDPPPPRRGGRARRQPAVDAAGDPQVGQLVRREQAQARPLDARARLRGQGRPQASPSTCSGSSATTPRSTRARSTSRGRWRGSSSAPGVDFGILYDGERNSGNDVRRVGEEGLFESLAEENVATLEECEFKRIVTSDPHSLNTLRNEYPALGGSVAGRPPHRVPRSS